VLIENGRIRAILTSGEAGSAGDAQMIDLKGRYLMPGLWDVHRRCRSVLQDTATRPINPCPPSPATSS
jgi:predicted amidohydrolase YtcJ